ncbi:putative ubiquitin-conjugating enzyme E2 W [Porphyridium purpureum]|uniref:Putative ubiquitin-conjugating enzyme E2 W n=1 Tax=Porphyridium purpureum TaxID=35688 RepID=A0A5J4Z7L4_PORPP|nr:putative ubiquitin-conjugating enzyme E2 W [Porphyridium purpureum]|eukprot:POR5588..scf295_1
MSTGSSAVQHSRTAIRRLQKELDEFQTSAQHSTDVPLPNCEVRAESLDAWFIEFEGADNTVFAGERFVLRFVFPPDYPIESPEVVFVPPNTPLHPHVYSNGHICLSILYDGWSPALTVRSICLSILSMLSSATKKELPPDNERYVRTSIGRSPKRTRWDFHDDKV